MDDILSTSEFESLQTLTKQKFGLFIDLLLEQCGNQNDLNDPFIQQFEQNHPDIVSQFTHLCKVSIAAKQVPIEFDFGETTCSLYDFAYYIRKRYGFYCFAYAIITGDDNIQDWYCVNCSSKLRGYNMNLQHNTIRIWPCIITREMGYVEAAHETGLRYKEIINRSR
jgi:hypothetical protein